MFYTPVKQIIWKKRNSCIVCGNTCSSDRVNFHMQRELGKPITGYISCSCSVLGSPKCFNSASKVIFISQ